MSRATQRLLLALLGGSLFLAAVLIFGLGLQVRGLLTDRQFILEAVRSPAPGQWFPALELQTIEGDIVCIGRGLAEPQLLAFLRPDCSGCAEAATHLSAFAHQRADHGLPVIGVSFSDEPSARTFAQAHDLTIPIVALSHPQWPSLFRVRDLPQWILLDAQGRVMLVHRGLIPEGFLSDSIAGVVASLPRSQVLEAEIRWAMACRDEAELLTLTHGGSP